MNNNNKSQFFGTREETSRWLDKYKINNYTISYDLSVDVNGSVDIFHKSLKIIPVKFAKVLGNFDCSSNQLINLIGSPKTVGGNFWCQDNKLTSLAGSPETIGDGFDCDNNELTNLIGAPKTVGGNFWCENNFLFSLLEMADCNFKGRFSFNIDEKNFKQKELIQILKKYFNLNIKYYQLTNHQFHDVIKAQIAKEALQQKLIKSEAKLKLKNKFI